MRTVLVPYLHAFTGGGKLGLIVVVVDGEKARLQIPQEITRQKMIRRKIRAHLGSNRADRFIKIIQVPLVDILVVAN